MPAYALTIFIGAFLLFQVQPLIGKYILPWFGGGPGVWTTCMLFFQVVLLAGYAYAHFVSRWLKPRTAAVFHLLLVGAALATLPVIPAESWKPNGGGNPVWQILALLGMSIGLPYFVLSTTGPLMQYWFCRTHPGVPPYRLYALSNIGSLLALVSFPFLVEPRLTRHSQAIVWGWGLAAYGIACAVCALELWRAHRSNSPLVAEGHEVPPEGCLIDSASLGNETGTAGPSVVQRLLWLLLPACASVLLLATTNKMCLDVAVIPFLWVLPLAIYLLSFIICFDSPRWYVRFPFTLLLAAALGGLCWAIHKGSDVSIAWQITIYSAGLFICCMVCHGELYRLKPDPRHLTEFYLLIAAGGALGGCFVAIFAPLAFKDYYELHWGLFLCAVLFVAVCLRDRSAASQTSAPDPARGKWANFLRTFVTNEWVWIACALPLIAFVGADRGLVLLNKHFQNVPRGYFTAFRIALWTLLLLLVAYFIIRKQFQRVPPWKFLACSWLMAGTLALAFALWKQTRDRSSDRIYSSRNFYGVLTVYEHRKDDPQGHHFLLQHGRITHGLQFVDSQQARWPTTYYGAGSGVSMAVKSLPQTPRRIGVVGLGTGTMAAFGRAGDYLRIYEINQAVQRLAWSPFGYLSNCLGQAEVALGDARLSMERESSQQFDLLALDAFSSDAIPVHLLTQQAFEVYSRHVKTNGIIAVHISNHYLNLEPVVVNLARHFGYKLAMIDYDEDEAEWWNYSSTWVLLTRNEDLLNCQPIKAATVAVKTNNIPLWTDDFASLFQILKR